METKRTLVRQSLLFYAAMGTPGAVDQLIRAIFSTGQMEEWFEYGGEPHHFRATIGASGLTITPEALEELRRVLSSVKRLSSWLDSIATVTPMESRPVRVAAAPCGSYARDHPAAGVCAGPGGDPAGCGGRRLHHQNSDSPDQGGTQCLIFTVLPPPMPAGG